MKDILEYFEEIIRIPRESGKEEKIAKYLVDFAIEQIHKDNNLIYELHCSSGIIQ